MDCVLCSELLAKSRTIKETEHTYSLVCKHPLMDGHVMVLPKRCLKQLDAFTKEESKDFLAHIHWLRARVKEVYGKDPLVVQNFGKHSTQPHIHYHIFPSDCGIRALVAPRLGVDIYPPDDAEQLVLIVRVLRE